MRRHQRWTVQKRSHEAARRKVHKEHRRLRNGLDGGGRHDIEAYIGVKTGSFPLEGPGHSAGPLLCTLLVLTKPLCRGIANGRR
jgi:hypothetical protein